MTVDTSAIAHTPTDIRRSASDARKRVLVVDDNAELRAMITAVLRERGCDVEECDGTPSALFGIEIDALDAAVIDLIMPDVHGLEYLRHLRGRPHGAELPVVLMSSLPAGRTRERACFEVAAMPNAEFLDKPVTGRALARALTALTNR